MKRYPVSIQFRLVHFVWLILLTACAPDPTPTAIPVDPTLTQPAPTALPDPTATPTHVPTLSASTGQSSLVAFVKDGNVQVWDEATGQGENIFEAGDVTSVTISEDGELVAFLRRAYFAAGDFDQHEKSALWVVELDGENPRELVSAEALRELLNAAETDSTNFPQLAWIPGTHRLLYSGWRYFVVAEGESHAMPEGVYSVDADSLERSTLVPAGNNLHFEPSPDGGQIALISSTGVSFMNADGSNPRQAMLTYPATGGPMRLIPGGVWTQDASALLVAAPKESEPGGESEVVIWRVPVDGSPAQPLAALTVASYGSITFSPDGRSAAFYRQQTHSGWFVALLTPEAGLLVVPKSTYLGTRNLHWSPAGVPYAIHEGALDQLCPEATQDVEVCRQGPVLGKQVAEISWMDGARFVFVTREPTDLYFGGLDGRRLLLGEGVDRFSTALIPCRNDSEITAGASNPADMSVTSNTLFAQTWHLHNTGTCAWDASFRLAYAAGERLSGPRSLPLGEIVPPGGEIELSLNLIAPPDPGRYQGEWQLFGLDALPFGDRAVVDIAVPSFTVTELAPDQIGAKIPSGGGKLAFGEGALWQMNGNAMSRIDLGTNQVVASIPVGDLPTAHAATGYGAVWTYANGAILRIDPQTNQINGSMQLDISAGLHCLITGAGSVWACTGGEGLVQRIDPTTMQVIATIPVEPGALGAATTENALWVVDAAGLKRIDVNTYEVTAVIPLDCPARKVAVDDQAVWVPCFRSPVVYRIDPLTNQVLARIAIPGRPVNLVSDSNAIWMTSGNMLTRIDPAANQVSAVYQFDEALIDVIAAEGEIFVTSESAIWRIRP